MAVGFFDPLGSLLRAGGGLLWMGIAVLILAVGPRTWHNRALAAAVGGWNVGTVMLNAAYVWPSFRGVGYACDIAGNLVAAGGLAWLFHGQYQQLGRAQRLWTVSMALTTFVALIFVDLWYSLPLRATNWLLGPFPASYQWIAFADQTLALPYYALLVGWGVAAIELARGDVDRRRAEATLLTASFVFLLVGVHIAFDIASTAALHNNPDWGARWQGPTNFLLDATGVVAVFALLRVAGRPGGRLAVGLMLSSLAVGCIGSPIPLEAIGAFGVYGIVLILAGLVFLFGVFYRDSLGVHLRTGVVRRGTLASLGLATLFITAQVAQNFLSDSFGLLIGGIVAGAVVFAALPLQKAVERRLGPDKKGEQGFRTAARLALRDHKLTADEERQLVVLAHQLGVPPDRAFAILEQEGKGGA